ncbi:phosphopentomutase [Chitinivorax sp. B]|uniref:phosphopentomutase n=1 Tax=Chitinivorax sp. B TaxID=2502235 RepID=UPI0010F88580|nr:phosphopentomutase [Chitinivorax sp. B]
MRVIFLIMDSLGIGATPDAMRFGDQGANTLGHIAEWCAAGKANVGRQGPLHIPNLERLGMGLASQLASGSLPAGMSPTPALIGAYAAAREQSSGKDTPSGHWELAGVPVLFDWGYFDKQTDTFPPELLDKLVRRAKLPGYLGNCHASGTTILEQLGEEHMKTGKPIFYTSADSVFQIACHEDTFGLDRLYEVCEIAREEVDRYNICRVIARPFVGLDAASFKRTGNRHDLAVSPPAPTVLQKLAEVGGQVVSIGKIADIYAQVGITQAIKATGLDALWDTTLKAMHETPDHSIVMTNFVDFDQSYGHRRDVAGYAAGLEYFDTRLPECLAALRDDDVLIISADHGCDPTWPGSDHTREHVPVLLHGKQVKAGSLGIRSSFADVGQSMAQWFGLTAFEHGQIMLSRAVGGVFSPA